MDEIATLTVIGHDLCEAAEYVLGTEQDRHDIIDYALFYAKMVYIADACDASPIALIMPNTISAVMTAVAIKKVVAPRYPPLFDHLRQQRLTILSADSIHLPDIVAQGFKVVDEKSLMPRLFGLSLVNDDPGLLLDLVHLAAQNRAMVFQYLLDFMGSYIRPSDASVKEAIADFETADAAIDAYRKIARDPRQHDEFQAWNARRKIAILRWHRDPTILRDFFFATECIISPWKSLTFRTIPCIGCFERDACRGSIRWVSTHCKYCAFDLLLLPTMHCVHECGEHFETRDEFDHHINKTCRIRNPYACQVRGCSERFSTQSLLVKHVHKHKVHTLQLQ